LDFYYPGGREAPVAALIFTSPLIAYWGYRFIKNDISFLKSSEKEEA